MSDLSPIAPAPAAPLAQPAPPPPTPAPPPRYRLPGLQWLLWVGGFALFALFIIWNRDWPTFLNYLRLGLPQGAVIALIAVGYSMVYGIIQLINFAHGEVFMFGAYFVLMLLVPCTPGAWWMIEALLAVMGFCALWAAMEGRGQPRGARPTEGDAAAWRGTGRLLRWAVAISAAIALPTINALLMPRAATADAPATAPLLPFFGACLVAALYAACLGVTVDTLAYKPLRNSPRLIPLVTAIGLSLLLQNLAQLIWGSSPQAFPESLKPALLGTQSGGALLGFSRLDIGVLGLAAALLVALELIVMHTRTGRAMRACAQDRATAALMGVQVNRVVALAFALGALLAAMVAPLYVLRGQFIAPTMGYIIGILAFSSAVLGGIGNITGAVLGGLVLGIIYTFVPLFDALDTFRLFAVFEGWGWVSKAGYQQFKSSFGGPGQYQLGVAYAFMIVVIVLKPTGLLGKASAARA